MDDDRTHIMKLNAIYSADPWYHGLTRQKQLYVEEIAAKVMSQGIVMFARGDRRRGLDMFPDAWENVVRKPPEGWELPKFFRDGEEVILHEEGE